MNKPHDEPAFPSHGTMGEVTMPGLTKLEYFSAIFLQGHLANPDVVSTVTTSKIIQTSVACAEALLDELEKRKSER